MIRKDQKIEVIKPPTRIKYKKFCKNIYRKYRKQYISHNDNNQPIIDTSFLTNLLVEKLKPLINDSYVRNKKYDEIDFINGIIDVLNNGTYWNRYKDKISGKYLNKRHNRYCEWGVYECLYRIISLSYYSTNKYNKLKYQCIDSTFIKNLYGSEIYGRNVEYKSKNGIKVSVIVDINGVLNSFAIGCGNSNDGKIALQQINNNMLIDTDTSSVKNNNRFKQIMIADAAYYSKELYSQLKKKGYTPITDVNKRNTKKKELLKIIENDKKKYQKIQGKLLKVKNFNAWIKKYPKIDRLVEKSVKSFIGLLLLGCSMILINKLD